MDITPQETWLVWPRPKTKIDKACQTEIFFLRREKEENDDDDDDGKDDGDVCQRHAMIG